MRALKNTGYVLVGTSVGVGSAVAEIVAMVNGTGEATVCIGWEVGGIGAGLNTSILNVHPEINKMIKMRQPVSVFISSFSRRRIV